MQRDDGLPGARGPCDACRAVVPAFDDVPLRRVQEHGPLLPGVVERSLQLFDVGHQPEPPLRVWENLQSGDNLGDLARWEDEGQGPSIYFGPRYPEADQGPLFDRSNPLELAIIDRIEEGDGQAVMFAYLVMRTSSSLTEVQAQMRFDSESGRGRLGFASHGLRSAIWLQFARAIDGSRTFRRCQQCGDPFEVAPDVARTNRRYCSGTCRSAQLRGRRVRARELRRRGVSADTVAAAVDTSVEVIERWEARGWR